MNAIDLFRKGRIAAIIVKRSKDAAWVGRTVWNRQGGANGEMVRVANELADMWIEESKKLSTEEMISIMMNNGDETLVTELAEFDNMKFSDIAKKLAAR